MKNARNKNITGTDPSRTRRRGTRSNETRSIGTRSIGMRSISVWSNRGRRSRAETLGCGAVREEKQGVEQLVSRSSRV